MTTIDSQLTLTEPSTAEPRTSAILVFDADSMRKTTIRLRGHDEALYSVRSSKDYMTTELLDARTGESVAKIQKRSLLPDQITLRGRATASISSWLRSRKEYPVTFESGQGRYRWSHDAQRRLALFHENERITEPIAWFSPSGPTGPATLALTRDAERMRDEVVAALLILEQDLRVGYAVVPHSLRLYFSETRLFV